MLPMALVMLFTLLIVSAGSIAFLLPGIYLSICISFAYQVTLDEKKKGLEAIIRSKDLVAGRWWKVFGLTLLVALIFAIVPGIVRGILQMAFSGNDEINAAFVVVETLYYAFVFIIATPLMTAFQTVLYRHLVAVKGAHAVHDLPARKTRFIALMVAGVVALIMMGWGIYSLANFAVRAFMDAQQSGLIDTDWNRDFLFDGPDGPLRQPMNAPVAPLQIE